MNKRAIFILGIGIFIALVIIYVIFTGNNNEQNKVDVADEITTNKKQEIIINEAIETSSQDEKTTPNTILILKKYYQDCGHTISGKASIPEEMVNLTKDEISQKYPGWELEQFSKDEVILYKEVDSFCGEHYFVTEEDGYISIYNIDEEENKKLKEKTNLSVEYLTETDKINLKNGIIIYGTEELNKLIEDFEI